MVWIAHQLVQSIPWRLVKKIDPLYIEYGYICIESVYVYKRIMLQVHLTTTCLPESFPDRQA